MASTNKTPNYNLPQWVATDKPQMADFNTAMADIDTNINLVSVRPACKVGKTATQSIANNTELMVSFNREDFDSHNMHSNTVENQKIVIPQTGIYSVLLNIGFVVNTNGIRTLSIYVNGAILQSKNFVAFNDYMLLSLSAIVKLNAGVYIHATVRQTSGSSINVVAESHATTFSAVKISD